MTNLGYGCAGDDCRNPVNWLLTHMQPPGTLSVCDDHLPVFAIGMLAAHLGVDAGKLYDVVKRHVDREAAKQAKAAQAQAAYQPERAAEQAEQADHSPDWDHAGSWDNQPGLPGHSVASNEATP